MMPTYQRTPYGFIRLEFEDGRAVEFDGEGDSDQASTYRADVKAGATVLDAPPLPDPGPTRDERLLDAVSKASAVVDTALDASPDFTAKQKLVLKMLLKGAFGKLGDAIRGG